ncbi:Bromodomain and WD repeat-containing protein 3, partial [Orchesella cincta]
MDSTERNSKPFLDLSNPLYKEVFFLVAQFLSGTPCQRAAKALIEELEAHELIPERVNWLGQTSPQDFNSFVSASFDLTPKGLGDLNLFFDF